MEDALGLGEEITERKTFCSFLVPPLDWAWVGRPEWSSRDGGSYVSQNKILKKPNFGIASAYFHLTSHVYSGTDPGERGREDAAKM